MATINPASQNLTLRRGDSLDESVSTLENDSGALAITSAIWQIRDGNRLIHAFTVTISGVDNNILTRAEVSSSATRHWPVGIFSHELEFLLADGRTRGWVKGTFTITDDIAAPIA